MTGMKKEANSHLLDINNKWEQSTNKIMYKIS